MPEIALDQQRSVRGILLATGRIYRRYPLLFVTLAVAVMGPYDLVVLAVTGYGPLRHGHQSLGTFWLLNLLSTSLITPLISALHVHAVLALGEARRPRLGGVALRGLQVLPVVAAADIVASIGIALGFLALLVPDSRWAAAQASGPCLSA